MRRILSLALSLVMLFNQTGLAQGVAELGLGRFMGTGPAALALETFRPLHLRYLAYDSVKDGFELYLDKGDAENVGAGSQPALKGRAGLEPAPTGEFQVEAQEVFNYFLIGLSLPNEVFWVNLRPDSPERIIDDQLARTNIGKVMLEADLQLKKDLALATSPQTPQGKAYWDKLYQKAGELFGSEQVEIPTYTRPWIVPGEVILRETTDEGRGTKDAGWTTDDGRRTTDTGAYVYKAALKVMLEEDYVGAGSKPALDGRAGLEPAPTMSGQTDPRYKALNAYSSELIRQTIIPQLTKEVNTARRYAGLRQVYYSLILAQWFKQRNVGTHPSVRPEDIGRTHGSAPTIGEIVDSRNLAGLTSTVAWSKTTYFDAYQKSFQQGEYRQKETVSTSRGPVVRTYTSGGMALFNVALEVNSKASAASVVIEPLKTDPDFIPCSSRLSSSSVSLGFSYGFSTLDQIDTLPEEDYSKIMKVLKKVKAQAQDMDIVSFSEGEWSYLYIPLSYLGSQSLIKIIQDIIDASQDESQVKSLGSWVDNALYQVPDAAKSFNAEDILMELKEHHAIEIGGRGRRTKVGLLLELLKRYSAGDDISNDELGRVSALLTELVSMVPAGFKIEHHSNPNKPGLYLSIPLQYKDEHWPWYSSDLCQKIADDLKIQVVDADTFSSSSSAVEETAFAKSFETLLKEYFWGDLPIDGGRQKLKTFSSMNDAFSAIKATLMDNGNWSINAMFAGESFGETERVKLEYNKQKGVLTCEYSKNEKDKVSVEVSLSEKEAGEIEMYARKFLNEDEDGLSVVFPDEVLSAIDGQPGVSGGFPRQLASENFSFQIHSQSEFGKTSSAVLEESWLRTAEGILSDIENRVMIIYKLQIGVIDLNKTREPDSLANPVQDEYARARARKLALKLKWHIKDNEAFLFGGDKDSDSRLRPQLLQYAETLIREIEGSAKVSEVKLCLEQFSGLLSKVIGRQPQLITLDQINASLSALGSVDLLKLLDANGETFGSLKISVSDMGTPNRIKLAIQPLAGLVLPPGPIFINFFAVATMPASHKIFEKDKLMVLENGTGSIELEPGKRYFLERWTVKGITNLISELTSGAGLEKRMSQAQDLITKKFPHLGGYLFFDTDKLGVDKKKVELGKRISNLPKPMRQPLNDLLFAASSSVVDIAEFNKHLGEISYTIDASETIEKGVTIRMGNKEERSWGRINVQVQGMSFGNTGYITVIIDSPFDLTGYLLKPTSHIQGYSTENEPVALRPGSNSNQFICTFAFAAPYSDKSHSFELVAPESNVLLAPSVAASAVGALYSEQIIRQKEELEGLMNEFKERQDARADIVRRRDELYNGDPQKDKLRDELVRVKKKIYELGVQIGRVKTQIGEIEGEIAREQEFFSQLAGKIAEIKVKVGVTDIEQPDLEMSEVNGMKILPWYEYEDGNRLTYISVIVSGDSEILFRNKNALFLEIMQDGKSISTRELFYSEGEKTFCASDMIPGTGTFTFKLQYPGSSSSAVSSRQEWEAKRKEKEAQERAAAATLAQDMFDLLPRLKFSNYNIIISYDKDGWQIGHGPGKIIIHTLILNLPGIIQQRLKDRYDVQGNRYKVPVRILIPKESTLEGIEKQLLDEVFLLKPSASSSAVGDVGGIDLRYIEFVQEAGGELELPPLEELRQVNLSRERAELERMLSAHLLPSSERMTNYVAASCVLGSKEEAAGLLIRFYRQEEAACRPADKRLSRLARAI